MATRLGSNDPPGTEYPFVSVVVPCRNEEAFIEGALGSILANDWPAGRMEVLVIDGESDDGTREIIGRLAEGDGRVKLLDNPGRFAGAAMKIGVTAARGDYVLRVDAHAEIPPDYIRTGMAILGERPDVWAVGGPVDRVAVDEAARLVAAINSNIFSTGNTRVRVGRVEGPVDAVLYPIWPRALFDRVGEFDESLVRNQDDDFHYRVRRAGGVIYQSQKMRARYYVRGSVRKLLRQYHQYAFWKVAVAKKHGRFLDWKPLAPPAFFGAVAAAAAAGFFWRGAWLVGGVLAAAYVAADVAASAAVARKAGPASFFRALGVFPVLHFQYAAGIASGIWYSVIRGLDPPELKRIKKYSGLTR